MTKLHEWEKYTVHYSSGEVGEKSRLAVPGGWLYYFDELMPYVPDPSAPHVAKDAETRIRKARKVYADAAARSDDGGAVNFGMIAGIMDGILEGGKQ